MAERAALNRAQLEHVIRASAAISGDDEIVVIGSQSILGQFPAAPPELCVSNEADVYPKNKPEMADVIDGAIGELSMFHETSCCAASRICRSTRSSAHASRRVS